MLFKVALGVCSIRVLAKNHGDPYYEPTIVVHDNRGEYPTLIYPCRRAYRKVMMEQQGFVVCDVPEVKNI